MNGLNFKGHNSREYGFVMKSINRPLSGDVNRQTVQVPGLHGVVDFKNDTYPEKPLTVLLQFNYKHSMANLMELMEQVGAWLFDDGNYYDLWTDDQPTRVYKAKMVTKVDVSPSNSIAALQVTFTCNPPFPYVNGILLTPDEILWQTAAQDGNQYYQSFTAPGYMRFFNKGILPVKPVIKLIGNIPSGMLLAYGTAQWQYNAALQYDGIIIDCTAETVTRASNGANLMTNVDTSKDDYFNFIPGQIEVDLTAAGLGEWPESLDMIIEIQPQGAS